MTAEVIALGREGGREEEREGAGGGEERGRGEGRRGEEETIASLHYTASILNSHVIEDWKSLCVSPTALLVSTSLRQTASTWTTCSVPAGNRLHCRRCLRWSTPLGGKKKCFYPPPRLLAELLEVSVVTKLAVLWLTASQLTS